MNAAPPLRILTGPTASGKTALALEWARRRDGWILSCDALLFYRGADIGTAKPTAGEQRLAPHFGIDLCEPDQPYDLPSYIAFAKTVLGKAREAGAPVLVAGGSGFYLAAFHDPAPDPIDINPGIKATVRGIAEREGAEGLRDRLLEIDPEPDIDLSNPRRTAPALERCLATGLSTRELKKRRENLPCPFADWERRWFRLDPDDALLADRVNTRTRAMLDNGLVAEVERLRSAGFERNPTLSRAIGYREVLDVLDGTLRSELLEETIHANTLRLARRQRKWIRNRLPETRPAEELFQP